ncbi:unnamed protein product (macronuclear) [Paramecium tetraurelia]|uniref:CCT-beta n=1 Tax=Paramecium tetraurelia TaxID=5888 RepID=A0EHG6_PARTE|nr:uncharacterized protein GSPATT00027081001 [Paramecium tetraurelia]CAK94757.1 unnamed protein product [Paramecium tetraurelia]|eukprot:XP_001462130.1 hypothetical protein (macronuclear) [Paramecium tetraurelia strain d4-2]
MDIVGNVLPQVLKDEATEHKGEMARLQSFVGAIAVADLVKTTLGPKGMDKILKPTGPGQEMTHITVTNDGATILKSMYVENPAAKILIEISKTQDEEVGDGTTTVAVLAGELLREGEKLIQKRIHPQHLEMWHQRDQEIFQLKMTLNLKKFHNDLIKIARTTLSSKLITTDRDYFADLCVKAVLRLKGSSNLDYIQIIKLPGGTIRDSYLDDGFILKKQITIGCKRRIENAKILVANTAMDYDKIKIYGTKVKVNSMDKVAEIEAAEKEKMKHKVDKILKFQPTVFVNRQLIYNYPEQLLADSGITVIEHADFEGMERVAAATGAEILSTFDAPERRDQVLGHCDLIEEIMIGEEKMIKFTGCKKNEACTIVLRGSSIHILDEVDRSIHDVLCVLITTVKNRRVVWGGGNSEMQMAAACEEEAKKVQGKQALAIEAYARALRQIPTIICDNGGYDSAELIQNFKTSGLNMNDGTVGDMKELGIKECMRVKEQAVMAASEAAELIMRVDDIVKCAPRKRERA